MQMFACGSRASIAWNTKLLTGIDHVTDLDINAVKMHVGGLILTAILTIIFNSHGFSASSIDILIDLDNLTIILSCQYCLMLRLKVDTLVELLLPFVDGVISHTKRRSDKHELITFQRETILCSRGRFCSLYGLTTSLTLAFCYSQRILCCSERLTLSSHLLHDHLVVLLKIGSLDDTYNSIDIVLGGGITTSLDASSPSFVVIRR